MKINPHGDSKNTEAEIPEPRPDDAGFNLRELVRERLTYGLRPTESDLVRIREVGYVSYFMKLAKSPGKIGGRSFRKLRSLGRLDLTTEYVLFHRFRNELDPQVRRRIAAILAESVSHPHARWESRPED
jgi:hypothetical protein